MTKKTRKLIDTLRKDWPHPECAFIEEFRGGTGWSRDSRADAVAMHLWPSEGLELIGFELKTSRADWIRELKDPLKCEPIKQFCDRWFLVIDEYKIAREDEIPDEWGLMVMSYKDGEEKMVVVKEAPKLEPEQLDKPFIAALMRRASKPHDNVTIDGRVYTHETK